MAHFGEKLNICDTDAGNADNFLKDDRRILQLARDGNLRAKTFSHKREDALFFHSWAKKFFNSPRLYNITSGVICGSGHI